MYISSEPFSQEFLAGMKRAIAARLLQLQKRTSEYECTLKRLKARHAQHATPPSSTVLPIADEIVYRGWRIAVHSPADERGGYVAQLVSPTGEVLDQKLWRFSKPQRAWLHGHDLVDLLAPTDR